jgi:hypothetical protein
LLNKTDLVPEDRVGDVNGLAAALAARGSVVLRGSGATGQGTRELVIALVRTLDEVGARDDPASEEEEATP